MYLDRAKAGGVVLAAQRASGRLSETAMETERELPQTRTAPAARRSSFPANSFMTCRDGLFEITANIFDLETCQVILQPGLAIKVVLEKSWMLGDYIFAGNTFSFSSAIR